MGAPDTKSLPAPPERPSAAKGSAKALGKVTASSQGKAAPAGPSDTAKAGLIQYGGTTANEAQSSSSQGGSQRREPMSRILDRAAKARAD